MHRVTVTPLPATPQDEPIEVGSYWHWQVGDSTVVAVEVNDDEDVEVVNLRTGEASIWSGQNFRDCYVRLRNVRIEIEVK